MHKHTHIIYRKPTNMISTVEQPVGRKDWLYSLAARQSLRELAVSIACPYVQLNRIERYTPTQSLHVIKQTLVPLVRSGCSLLSSPSSPPQRTSSHSERSLSPWDKTVGAQVLTIDHSQSRYHEADHDPGILM